MSDAIGGHPTLLQPDTDGSFGGALEWPPFLPKETAIAESGSTFYHKAASGFLIGQSGSQFGSVVAFTATTPSSAAIQAIAPTHIGATRQPGAHL